MAVRDRSSARSSVQTPLPRPGRRGCWSSDPLFYPAKPPAHWLMVAEVTGEVLVVPLAPSASGDPRLCRPIGCYVAAEHLAKSYREDR